MAGLGRGDEGYVPSKREVLEKGFGVKVGAEGGLPGGDVEGWTGERDAETVHVGRASESDGGRDPVDEALLVGRARPEGNRVTGAG